MRAHMLGVPVELCRNALERPTCSCSHVRSGRSLIDRSIPREPKRLEVCLRFDAASLVDCLVVLVETGTAAALGLACAATGCKIREGNHLQLEQTLILKLRTCWAGFEVWIEL